MRKIVFSDKEVADIVHNYSVMHESTLVISAKYDCSRSVIANLLKSSGVSLTNYARTYFFNEDYFHAIDTPDKAYWLGLIFADGGVHDDTVARVYQLQIGLQRRDKHILVEFLRQIGHNGSVKDIETEKSIGGRPPKKYYSSKIIVSSKKMIADLRKFGVIPNKTLRLTFPDLTQNLRRHFVRGLFDGDGCICVFKRADGYANGMGQSFSICGQESLLAEVAKIISQEVGLTQAIPHKQKDKMVWEIKHANPDHVKAVRKWLYSDTNLYLLRKYNKFLMV